MLIGMIAETAIHPGAGRNAGAIDLPVAREAATDYPVLVGSSLKGALKERAREQWPHKDDQDKLSQEVQLLFGVAEDGAGQLLISDARLLLLPVRSLTGQYQWVTCPYLLERFQRDAQRAGQPVNFAIPTISPNQTEAISNASDPNTMLFLEERQFKIDQKCEDSLIEAIRLLIAHSSAKDRLKTQLTIVSNDDFAWFARYALAVNARNVLDSNTKTSQNLWYEETLPPDTLMYALIAQRSTGQNGRSPLAIFRTLFEGDTSSPYFRAGGNETVGQGWFAVALIPATPAKESH